MPQLQQKKKKKKKKNEAREFPGGLVVKIPCFHYCGLGSLPGLETEILTSRYYTLWEGEKKSEEFLSWLSG